MKKLLSLLKAWWNKPKSEFKQVKLWNPKGKWDGAELIRFVPRKRPPTREHDGWTLDNYTSYMWEDEETSVKNGDTPRPIGGRNIPAVKTPKAEYSRLVWD